MNPRIKFLPSVLLSFLVVFVLLAAALNSCQVQKKIAGDPAGLQKVKHVVVIYMENHSFDNLYGQFEGADGLTQAKEQQVKQLDSLQQPYTYLPQIPGSSAFPMNLNNTYFNIDQYVPSDQEIPDVLHRFYQEQWQIDSGRMDKFALYNTTAGLTMGYYKTSNIPLAALAHQYTLCDHFFHSAFGCSYLNHQFLIAATAPVFPNAPDGIKARFDGAGKLIKDGLVTPDGYTVNTMYSVNTPHPAGIPKEDLVPYQTNPTIGDRLSDKGISWAWYAGGWDTAMSGKDNGKFSFHHQPFIYFARYAEGTAAKKEHLKDETEYMEAARTGHLPAVSFVKPSEEFNEHPGNSDVQSSEQHAVELINAALNGPDGKDVVVILTYDENGGFWDHVAPPARDRFGPGTRIPAIIISPFAKKGFVDHTPYETVSILAFIERRWQLAPLNDRDKNADPMFRAFDF